MAFKEDILLLPFNADLYTGHHWILGIIIFKTREIITVDSAKDREQSQQHGNILLTAAAGHQIVGIPFKHAEWEIMLCEDTAQQKKSYDWSILNIECLLCDFRRRIWNLMQ